MALRTRGVSILMRVRYRCVGYKDSSAAAISKQGPRCCAWPDSSLQLISASALAALALALAHDCYAQGLRGWATAAAQSAGLVRASCLAQ